MLVQIGRYANDIPFSHHARNSITEGGDLLEAAATAALGLGSCCVAAFDQKLSDNTLKVNGTDEYTVYAIPIGKDRA